MRISFKYRFIISFVVLEVIFLIMIATVNFSSMERNSSRFIEEKIKSLSTLGSKLISVPLSIYDLATLDNVLEGLLDLESVVSAEVYDARKQLVSFVGEKSRDIEPLKKVKRDIFLDDMNIGSVTIWLDFSKNYAEIKNAHDTTLFIIFLEILISIVLSYYIGFRLSRNLEELTDAANKIGHIDNPVIPKLKGNDEVTELAKAMKKMQNRITERNDALKGLNAKLQNTVHTLEEYEDAVFKGSVLTRGDIQGRIIEVNQQFCDMTGYSRDELIGKPHSILRDPNTPKKVDREMWNTLHKNQKWHGILKNKRKDGSSFYVDLTIIPVQHNGKTIEYLYLRHDVSELIKRKKDLIKDFQTDQLTNLGNRFKLFDDLNDIEYPLLAVLDIKAFKEINNLYGFDLGDRLIAQFGYYLSDYFSEEYYGVYRLHSDEFAILANGDYIEQQHFEHQIKKFQSNVQDMVFHVMYRTIKLTLTIGVALEGKDTLITNAIATHDMAKERNIPFLLYSNKIKNDEKYKKNILYRNKLVHALSSDKILAYFQPIINNKTGRVEKYETLARMEDNGDILSATDFLQTAKDFRLYSAITKKMIDHCFKKAIEYPHKEFSFNLSAYDFENQDTMEYLLSKLDKFDLGSNIVVEIVEKENVKRFDNMENYLHKIKSYGCKIAIDDFGSGYSNFDYLFNIDADYVKIDGSIIKEIDHNPNVYKVVVAIVAFAHANDMKTIAEYVHNESIYKCVCELGIDYSQGYFISEPKREI